MFQTLLNMVTLLLNLHWLLNHITAFLLMFMLTMQKNLRAFTLLTKTTQFTQVTSKLVQQTDGQLSCSLSKLMTSLQQT